MTKLILLHTVVVLHFTHHIKRHVWSRGGGGGGGGGTFHTSYKNGMFGHGGGHKNGMFGHGGGGGGGNAVKMLKNTLL